MPTLPKQDRPAREGARVASVETGLAAAAAKLAQQVSWKNKCTSLRWMCPLNMFLRKDKTLLCHCLRFRSSKSPLRGSTPKSSVPLLLSWLLLLSRLSQLLPLQHLPQSLPQMSAQTGEWIITLLVFWTMNIQQDQDLLVQEALGAAEPWLQVYFSLHEDLPCLHRTAALTLVHPLQVWPVREQQELVKVSINLNIL